MDDAAVWVSGIRPAGWDFDLDPRSAADASRGPWLEVTGTFRVERRARPVRPPRSRSGSRPATCVAPRRRQIAPLFAATGQRRRRRWSFRIPIPGEDDVPRETAVRLQFSRAILPETLSEHIRRLVRVAAPARRSADPAVHGALRSTTPRSITLSFVEPLAPLSAVRIELLPGIAGANGLAVAPSGYTFTTAR